MIRVVLVKQDLYPPHIKVIDESDDVVIIWTPKEADDTAHDLMSLSHQLRKELAKI